MMGTRIVDPAILEHEAPGSTTSTRRSSGIGNRNGGFSNYLIEP